MKKIRAKLLPVVAISVLMAVSASPAQAGLRKFILRKGAYAAVGGLVAYTGAHAARAIVNGSEQPQTFTGKVIGVEDGDTVDLLRDDHTTIRIRMTDIDAPEASHGAKRPGQPFSAVSKRFLSDLVCGKTATAQCFGIDNAEYNRQVCRLIVNGVDVNLEEIRQGMAWVNMSNPKYVRDQRAYKLHEQARQAKVGLWADPNPIPPWEWRRTCWKEGMCSGAGR